MSLILTHSQQRKIADIKRCGYGIHIEEVATHEKQPGDTEKMLRIVNKTTDSVSEFPVKHLTKRLNQILKTATIVNGEGRTND